MCNCNNSPGEAATEGGKELRQQAGEIMACEYIVLCQIPICAYLVIIILTNFYFWVLIIYSNNINYTTSMFKITISDMKANNYEVAEAGETITFRGLVARSTSQAFFLTFCTALGMASLALVLQIQFQDLVLPGIGSPNWFLLTLLSPYAGIYYWKSGDRVDDMKVKLATNDDDTLNEITIEGNDEEIDRFWQTLDLQEKGMVKVEGILS